LCNLAHTSSDSRTNSVLPGASIRRGGLRADILTDGRIRIHSAI
jgi:hypothetical protein